MATLLRHTDTARRLPDQFRPGDSIVFVRAHGLMNVLQHRNGLHRVITQDVAAALDWPLTHGYIAAQKELELVKRLAAAIPNLDFMQFIDVEAS